MEMENEQSLNYIDVVSTIVTSLNYHKWVKRETLTLTFLVLIMFAKNMKNCDYLHHGVTFEIVIIDDSL
jgi:hypothetical protein